MKKTIFSVAVLLSIVISGCDKVSNPRVVKNTVIGSKFVKNSNKAVSNSRKVLLEDYTGHRCLNCPNAARIIAQDLMPVYGEKLVVISVHEGQLAAPFGAEFPNDYRTEAGDVWGGSGGFGKMTEYPTGLVNRKNYNANGLRLSSSKWTSVVPVALADEPFILKLDVDTEYDTTVRALNVFVKGTFKTSYSNKINLVAMFLEDGLASTQIDGPLHVEDYEFEHMLRGNINGTWGEEFTSAAVLANDSAKWSITGFPIPQYTIKGEKGQAIHDKKVTVVVFAYDVTSREVIQVEKVKIR